MVLGYSTEQEKNFKQLAHVFFKLQSTSIFTIRSRKAGKQVDSE